MRIHRLRRSIRSIGGLALAGVAAATALVIPTASSSMVGATDATAENLAIASSPLTGSASAYLPINPVRILDTRTDDGIKRVFANSALSIDPVGSTGVAAAAGVDPDDITAVIVNTTMVNASSRGFATTWPTGSSRLTTSTNNAEFEGHTIPNLVIAPLGLDGKISVYASTNTDIILDVLGVFVASGPTAAGRFESLGPVRAFDSREEGDSPFDAGDTQTIDLREAGVPTSATGVVLNVTAVRSTARGFFRVWAADDPEPEHSSINVLSANYNAGNQVITGVSKGRIKAFSASGGGLTIDVTGYFTGTDAEVSEAGLFVPFSPGRLLDTRRTSGDTAATGGDKLDADETFALEIDGRLEVPAGDAKAVALNITAVQTDARGFVKAYPGDIEPETSSLNYTNEGQTVPNHAITSIDASTGTVTLQPSQQTHMVVDASGYFLAEGAVAPVGSAAVGKVLDPGTFVPDPLITAPPNAPYDFLFERGRFAATGARLNPPIRAAWDNCRPIRYALNIDLAENDEQVDILIKSIEEVEAGTGIDFQFAGVTSAGMNIDDPILLPEDGGFPFQYLPPDDNGSGLVDLVIGFSNAADTPGLSRGVIGVGGSLRTGTDSNGRADQVRGFAVIDVTDLYQGAPDSAASLRNIQATTTHELGHMMGLGHVDDDLNFVNRFGPGLAGDFSQEVLREQLMYPALNPSNEADYDDGDLLGLYELYANRPCSGSGSLDTDGIDDGTAGIDWSDVTIVRSHDDFG
ncbi:MAG: hypothetical protein AB8G14_17370 [Ilumatobacter sp.]